jgi:hypothetical protein
MTKTVVTQGEKKLLALIARVAGVDEWDTKDSSVNSLTVRNLRDKGLILATEYTHRPNIDPETESQRAFYSEAQYNRSKIRTAWRLRLTFEGAKVVL